MFRGAILAAAFIGLALPAQAASDLRVSGNANFSPDHSWENFTGASLTVAAAPGGGYPSIEDGNGTVLWNWTPRNLSLSVSFDAGNPDAGYCGGCGASWRSVSLSVGNDSCAGNRTLTLSVVDGGGTYILAEQGANLSLVNGTGWGNGVEANASVLPGSLPFAVSFPVPPGASTVTIRGARENDTNEESKPVGWGMARVQSATLAAPLLQGCRNESVALAGGPWFPLRFNGSGNFAVTGTVDTDALDVMPFATVEGQNKTATVTLSSGNLSFTGQTLSWLRVKAGTYALNATWAGLGCEGGNKSAVVTANRSYAGCVVIGSPPTPVNRPSGSGGGRGGAALVAVATPTPEPAPAQVPVSAGSSSLKSIAVVAAPEVAVRTVHQAEGGVTAEGVPEYGVLEIPAPPPGTPQEVPV